MSRKLLRAAIGTLCALVVSLSAAGQDAKLLALLHNNNQRIDDAITKGDLAPVRDLFASSTAVINPVGGVVTYDDFLSLLKAGTLKYTAISISEEKLTQAGTAAVLIWLSTDTGTMQGHPISGQYRRMEVWSRDSGQWKILAVQSTPVVAMPQ